MATCDEALDVGPSGGCKLDGIGALIAFVSGAVTARAAAGYAALLFALVALSAGACKGGGSTGNPMTAGALAALPDASPAPDLSSPDLSMPDFTIGANSYRYVLNSITLPTNSKEYTADFIGDGTLRNRLGSIVQILDGQGFSLQTEQDARIASGVGLSLLSFSTTDSSFDMDLLAGANLYLATPTPSPDFTGKGVFKVDPAVPKGVLAGSLTAGVFASDDPLTLTAPPTVHLDLTLWQGVSVSMPIVGARLMFKPTKSVLLAGQLTGAMPKTDVDSILIPALAIALDKIAHSMSCDPGSPCDQIKQLFDKDHDGSISLNEVQSNPLVAALFGPDVQLFDDQGKWKPNKNNSVPDSISLGVAFHGVPAMFNE